MGIGADLDIWDKLLDCVPSGQEFVPYGDVEDAFFDRYPAEADVLLWKYGHRWRDSAHPAGRYSMSVYLSGRLRELADRGELEVRWEPAQGEWTYNGKISHWRRTGQQPRTKAAPSTPPARPVAINDVGRIAAAAADLPLAQQEYTQDDFITALMETVLDYQMQAKAVGNALEHYRAERWDEIRALGDLEAVIARFPDEQQGNTELARYLWGNRHWTRARQLRDLVAFFRSIGVVDQPSLERWAARANYDRDFKGRVKGLGPAVFQWLVMRQGVDTVKPDVHVRRFAEAAVGRKLSDREVVDLVTAAAAQLGIPARELDWRIWEAARRG